jgi:flagellar basal body-associated protein FliL
MIVLVVVCVVMFLMLICVAPFCVRKWLGCTENVKKQAVADMEEEDDIHDPENVQASEVEVEVNLAKDHTDSNGGAIKSTMD